MPERILIVDDDLETLKLVGTMLEQEGYEISAANSGAQGLEKASEEQPNLIILDIMMPEMDGYEVTRRLRSDPQTTHIPIMMLTAKGRVHEKVAGFEAGADDFLTKPVHPDELTSRVKVLLSRSAKRPSAGPGKPGQIVSFIGVKGGVGTTTLAINTAVAMAQLVSERSVALAEMRPGQGNLGLMLGYPRPQALGNLLSKGHSELTTRVIESELEPHSTGVHLLMAAPSPDPQEADFSPEAAESLARNLAAMMDYVLLDLGDGLSPENEQLTAISEQVVICLEPQQVAIALAQQMLQELQELGLGPLRTNVVLINRVPSGLQAAWQSVQQALQKDILAIISPGPELAYQAVEKQIPIIRFQPGSIPGGQFRKLGEDLLALLEPVHERGHE